MTEPQIEAAKLVAQGRLSLTELAAKIGVCKRTITSWKQLPEFQEELRRLEQATRERIQKKGIGSKNRRLAHLDGLLRRSIGFMKHRTAMMEQGVRAEVAICRKQAEEQLTECLVEEQAKKPDQWAIGKRRELAAELHQRADNLLATLPMIRTGMARMELKSLHVGEKSYEVVKEFFYDAPLAAEIRSQMEQAAIETGDWKNKIQVERAEDAEFITAMAAVLTPDEIDAIEARIRAKAAHDPGNHQHHAAADSSDQGTPAAK